MSFIDLNKAFGVSGFLMRISYSHWISSLDKYIAQNG